MREPPADLVVLDLMLPGHRRAGGVPAAAATGEVPIIMLTALGDETDRVVGLELGADDYVTKPFSPRELALRVDSVLAPHRAAAPDDAAGRSPTATWCSTAPATRPACGGATLALTAREFDLLRFLVAHPGVAFSRDDLLQQVWGWAVGDSSTVTVHVRRLREKIEPDPTTAGPPGDRLGRRLPLGGGPHERGPGRRSCLIAIAWSGGVGLLGLGARLPAAPPVGAGAVRHRRAGRRRPR